MINLIGVTIPYELLLIGLGALVWSILRRSQEDSAPKYSIPSLGMGFFFLVVGVLYALFAPGGSLFLVLGITFISGYFVARYWEKQQAKETEARSLPPQ